MNTKSQMKEDKNKMSNVKNKLKRRIKNVKIEHEE